MDRNHSHEPLGEAPVRDGFSLPALGGPDAASRRQRADGDVPSQPFALGNPFRRPAARLAMRLSGAALERLLGLSTLNRLYAREWLPRRADGGFATRALDILRIGFDVDASNGAIPARDGAIVVANHPHGALDGLVLAAAVQRVRPDVRILGNHLLGRIPELRPLCFLLDVFGGPDAARSNASSLRDALRWLDGGGALIVFPAGEVSHHDFGAGHPVDSPWHSMVARLAERAGAAIVPVFVDGANSRVFRLAGRIHPLLRTALLPRELLRQRGRRVRVVVGAAVSRAQLQRFACAARRTMYLRLRTYALAGGRKVSDSGSTRNRAVVSPVRSALVAQDIARLPLSCWLLSAGDCDVFCAPAPELPHVLPEIGRLREATFREVGEGTGRACDIDAFDQIYRHLFVWNRARREIAGAYRIGRTDEVGSEAGVQGLYTRSLFRYGARFLSDLGPALELGRSFVRGEYQRDYGTLLLLWKGIGRVVLREPRYRMLFGPVSISAEYSEVSRELLVEAFSSARYRAELAPLVKPRRPLRWRQGAGRNVSVLAGSLAPEELHTLVSELEPDGKGLPVLLRQYLKLNARLLAFSVDPAFGNVVDALMVVDLLDVDRAVLHRYLGREGTAQFLGAHARPSGPAGSIEPAVVTV